MINLRTSSEQHYMNVMAYENSRRELYKTVLKTGMEYIHPSQFTDLPPAPKQIINKCVLMGIVTSTERYQIEIYLSK